MFWRLGIGAYQQHAPVRDMPEGGPDLLPVDYELVTNQLGARLERGHIGSGVRLRKSLAPDLLAAQNFGQIALFLLLGSVGDNGRAGHRQAEDIEWTGGAKAGEFLVENRHIDLAG